MTWHALHYPLRPGSETEVGELFRASGRPRFEVTDDAGASVGRLLGTLALVGAGTAVRVIEVDGSLPQVAGHMSRQPEVRAFETELEGHLAVPRDMRSPDGARAFFQRAALDAVRVEVDEQGGPEDWTGRFYPLAPGQEDAVRELAQEGGGPTLLLVGREKALRLARAGATDDGFPRRLAERLGADVTGVELTCVLSRRHDREV